MKKLFYLLIVALIFGPFAVVPLGIPAVHLYFIDIIVLVNFIVWIIKYWKISPRSFDKLRIGRDDIKIIKIFLLFIFIALFSLFLSPIQMTGIERIISSLYIIRFFAYGSIGMTVHYLIRTNKISQYKITFGLACAGVITAACGWLQYIFYDDLRNLYYLGWDPHYKRIFSFYFDPNYLGIILVLTIVVLFFIRMKSNVGIWIRRLMLLFVFVTLAFTYSRSSYLAFIGAMISYAFLKRKFIYAGLVILMLVGSLFILPRPSGEGVKLERTFSVFERIESYKLAYRMFVDHPLTGVGFNTVRYAKRVYGISWENLETSHSGAGFDSSLLFVLATTGIVGFTSFFYLLCRVLKNSGPLFLVSFIAVLIHSFFLNSLFYPWVMVWFWILVMVNNEVLTPE